MVGNVGIQRQTEYDAHHLVVIQRGDIVLIVAPACAVGLLAGEGNPAIGMLCNYPLLLLGREAAPAAGIIPDRQVGQRQVVQRGQVFYMGVADIQHLQVLTIRQRGYIGNVFAEGDFQELQILAIAEGLQTLDGSAGNNHIFQALHTGNKVAAIQPLIVADVHVLGVLAVNQVMAVVVHQIIDRTDHFRIRQGAALTIGNTPDHLGLMPVILANLGQHIIGEVAIVQHKALAVGQQIQRKAQLRLSFVTHANILENDFFIGSGQGLAEEFKGVVEYHIGSCRLQRLDIFLGQLTGTIGTHQLHLLQIGQQRQLFRRLRHIGRGHG